VRTRTLIGLSLCLTLLAAVVAHAQQVPMVRAKIPFSFSVAGNVVPAGQYEFTVGATGAVNVTGEGKPPVLVAVITRVSGAIHTSPKDAHVVFDKVGSNYALSELWIPGSDGYILATTRAAHEHSVVDAPMTK
jgi:hypothetical protein